MRSTLRILGLAAALAACGDDDDGDDDDSASADAAATIDAPASSPDAAGPPDAAPTFALTSTAFAEGGVIPDMNSCQGANVSPALAWAGGPAAQSYALVFTDVTDMDAPFIHSAIWDIPGSVMELPENVEKVAEPSVPAGSKQPLAYNGTTRGYLGPCPGSMHTYQFVIYALPVNPTPDLTLASTRAQVEAKVQELALDTASLSGTFTP
jgi:hypothetical protein